MPSATFGGRRRSPRRLRVLRSLSSHSVAVPGVRRGPATISSATELRRRGLGCAVALQIGLAGRNTCLAIGGRVPGGECVCLIAMAIKQPREASMQLDCLDHVPPSPLPAR
jgi:hypothetical protein